MTEITKFEISLKNEIFSNLCKSYNTEKNRNAKKLAGNNF